jgi:hypothetical protein
MARLTEWIIPLGSTTTTPSIMVALTFSQSFPKSPWNMALLFSGVNLFSG